MSYRYIFHLKAQEEYEASIKWYLERSQQAAENFIAAVDHALQLICEHPERWRNQYKNYYELGVKKYPFTIVYFIESAQQQVIIMAVYHRSRNPKRKYRK